jgi:hypothetical protein
MLPAGDFTFTMFSRSIYIAEKSIRHGRIKMNKLPDSIMLSTVVVVVAAAAVAVAVY